MVKEGRAGSGREKGRLEKEGLGLQLPLVVWQGLTTYVKAYGAH